MGDVSGAKALNPSGYGSETAEQCAHVNGDGLALISDNSLPKSADWEKKTFR